MTNFRGLKEKSKKPILSITAKEDRLLKAKIRNLYHSLSSNHNQKNNHLGTRKKYKKGTKSKVNKDEGKKAKKQEPLGRKYKKSKLKKKTQKKSW